VKRRRFAGPFVRFTIYALAVAALLVFRVIPAIRAELSRRNVKAESLTISGLDVAPDLIARAVSEYQSLYPDLEIETRGGGTLHAVDDLLNGRADVAFLSRPLTDGELTIVRGTRDSVLAFPVALGGVGVVAAEGVGLDSLPLGVLRDWVREIAGGADGQAKRPNVYAPDPNSGLWGALTSTLGLPPVVPERGVTWLATSRDVLAAALADPNGVGFISTLAVHEGPGEGDWQLVRVAPDSAMARAAAPSANAIETGAYPLPHYLYVSQLRSGSEHAAGFVTFLYSGRGQRWVRHEGYVPAREALREIILVDDPMRDAS